MVLGRRCRISCASRTRGWRVPNDMGQGGGEIDAGAGLAQLPHDLTRRDNKRGHQYPCAMPDELVLACFRLTRCNRLREVCALDHLPPSLCIAADDQTTLLTATEGVD